MPRKAPKKVSKKAPKNEPKKKGKKKNQSRKQQRVVNVESLTQDFDDLVKNLADKMGELHDEKEKGIKYLKSVCKMIKVLKKDSLKLASGKKKIKRKSGAPSGFLKPQPVSDEICKFIKVEPGTELSRVDITKGLSQYMRDNGLKDPDDGRIIHPDAALIKVLRLDKKKYGSSIKFCTIQKFIGVHFQNMDKKTKKKTFKKSPLKKKTQKKKPEPESESEDD
jgi:chromatin remodeling complex protein RSC6